MKFDERRRDVCVDVDECKESPQICHQLANCTNLPGAYSCTCKQGYVGSGKFCTGMYTVAMFMLVCERLAL